MTKPKHVVCLTEEQISTILYVMEGYVQGSDKYHFDDDFKEEVDGIFEELETVSDNINKPETFIPNFHD